MTPAAARKLALGFDGATERWSQGGPVIEIGGEFLVRVGTREPGTLQLKIDSFEERDAMIAAQPELFFMTDHFKSYKGVLARLNALDTKTLRALLNQRIAIIKKSKTRKKSATTKRRSN